jgi:plasmid stability protein
MASITIRRLDETLKARLRVKAAHNGRSMEEEAREILRHGLQAETPQKELDLATAIRRHFAHIGGVDLVLPRREAVRRPPKFKS